MKIEKISLGSDKYPELLSQIHAAPKEIFKLGADFDTAKLHLAVVGSRRASQYGREVTKSIVRELASLGIVIVSGLALGIDATAHQAALDAGGKTIAVLANGLDQIHPTTNRQLAEHILSSKGTIVSEYTRGTPPLKQHFPARNRIVAGLCQGVLITEAARKSGSLITAGIALEENRQVYAVPGSIHWPLSVGANQLIKSGAQVVTAAEDILQAMGVDKDEQPRLILEDDLQQKIVEILSEQPLTIDQLIIKIESPAHEISQAMTILELNGAVKPIGSGHWTVS